MAKSSADATGTSPDGAVTVTWALAAKGAQTRRITYNVVFIMSLNPRALDGPQVGDGSFDAYYYEHCCGRPYARNDEWLAFFGAIAERIVVDMRPRRVLDAGCALGLLVETLRDREVEAFGIDVSSFAITQVHERVQPYCRLGSLTDQLIDRYDLIVCIEVVEHMSPRDAELGIAQICHHTDDILFSSSPFDYKEPTHVNVHGPGYWAQQFARHGFFRDIDYDASFITPWAVRFRTRRDPMHLIVGDYERRFWELLVERNDVRSFSTDVQERLAQALRDLEQARVGLPAARAALASAEQQIASTQSELLHARHEWQHARQTVRNMERSVFWRIRRPWAWLRNERKG